MKVFNQVFDDIKSGKKNSLKVQLDVYVDDTGILRCGGRLQNIELTESARQYLIYISKSNITATKG